MRAGRQMSQPDQLTQLDAYLDAAAGSVDRMQPIDHQAKVYASNVISTPVRRPPSCARPND